MTIFGDLGDPAERRQLPRRVRTGWIVLIAALVLGLVMSFLPAPYVIEEPGPVFNTLGSQQQNGKDVPLISISGAETYPTSGSLDMLTVSAVGTREQPVSWFQVLTSWFDPTKAATPIDLIYPPNVTTDQSNQQNAALMVDSQQEATAAALSQLGIAYTTNVSVAAVAAGSPAQGVLAVGDEILSVNGVDPASIDQLRASLAANGTSTPATVSVRHSDGTEETVQITPAVVSGSDGPALGISAAYTYDFPFDVDIQLNNVGGPSAGMMFALGIIDMLTPGQLNGGQNVAGTGTIDAAGDVGAIGGIRQKMYGAREAGATWFLAPASNCNEVVGHVPAGLTVFAVSKLQDSINALNAISSGGDTSALPTCDTAPATP